MTLTAELVLPEDVELMTVDDLPASLRDRLDDLQPEDVVISRANSRLMSRVLDASTAAFVEQFRRPRRLVEAVLSHAEQAGVEPASMLDDAAVFTARLLSEGLLAEAGTAAARSALPLLTVGDDVDGWTVEALVQQLEDAEVYRLTGGAGRSAALKLMRDPDDPRADHEARILSRLPAGLGPECLGPVSIDGRVGILTEWIEGSSIAERAASLARHGRRGRAELAELLATTIDTFAALHRHDVLHGDIHPGNVLCGPSGPRLIDFGASVEGGQAAPPRTGAIEFIDPAWAAADLAGAPPPALTRETEAYAVAALLYRCLTGAPTHPATGDRLAHLDQIAHADPTPFAVHELVGWDRVEAVIRRGLAKHGRARHASLETFGRAFRAAAQADLARLESATEAARDRALAETHEFVVNHHEQGLPEELAPTASIAFGAGGVALFERRLGERHGDPGHLATAELWRARAWRDIDRPSGAQRQELTLTADLVDACSLHHGRAGLTWERLVAGHRLADDNLFAEAIETTIGLIRSPRGDTDLALGDPGVLLLAAQAMCLLDHEQPAARRIRSAVGPLIDSIWTHAEHAGPLGSHGLLGVAHGAAGIAYAHLTWCAAAHEAPPARLLAAVDRIADHARRGPAGIHWPIEAGGQATMPGWCNGTAGLVHLWDAAALAEPRFAALREEATDAVIAAGVSLDNLCCGGAGQVFAVLRAHRATGDGSRLTAARLLADEALLANPLPDPEYRALELGRRSLLKGRPGVLLAHQAAHHRAHEGMPLFELEPGAERAAVTRQGGPR